MELVKYVLVLNKEVIMLHHTLYMQEQPLAICLSQEGNAWSHYIMLN